MAGQTDAGEDDNGEAEVDCAAGEAEEQLEEPGPPEDVDLQYLLKEKLPIGDFISLADAKGLFLSSKETRALFSALVTLMLRFDVLTPGGCTAEEVAEARRRSQRIKLLLPQEPVSGPLGTYIRFPLRQIPLRRASIFRAMYKVIPMVKWEECTKVHFICNGGLAESLERNLRTSVRALLGCHPWILREDPYGFRNISRLEITLTQIGSLPEDVTFPRVTRVKVVCKDAAFADGALHRIEKVFPDMTRLHLEMRPSGLPPLCLPGFAAAEDFRISLREDPKNPAALGQGRQGGFFLAAHLLTLPFSWEGSFFNRLLRFQMDELTEKRVGLSTEKMADALASAPQLRRLGTVSFRLMQHMDITQEDCHLEELVVVMEIEDCMRFFNMMLPLNQQQRRCSLKRLGVHLLAPDGVIKPQKEVEHIICAGWHIVASQCLAPEGFVMFSQSQSQLLDTVFFQLPYLEPAHFSLDVVDYGERRLAVSTPIERSLRYNEPVIEIRPRGTLISGPLRPSAALDSFEDVNPASTGQGSMTRMNSLGSSHSKISGTRRPSTMKSALQGGLDQRALLLQSLSMPFVDVVEYLQGIKEEMGLYS